jgi:hypothetical protein
MPMAMDGPVAKVSAPRSCASTPRSCPEPTEDPIGKARDPSLVLRQGQCATRADRAERRTPTAVRA